jgi:hypothetical protein
MHGKHEGLARDEGNRHEIRRRVIGELRIDQLHERVVVGGDIDRLPIRGRLLEGAGAQRAAGARDVLDDDRTAQQRRHRIRHDAGHDVGCAGGRDGHDHADRPVAEE